MAGRRNLLVVLALVLFLFLSSRLFNSRTNTRPQKEPNPPVTPEILRIPGPPTYEKLWRWEQDLPQHNLELPFPEGKTGRAAASRRRIKLTTF
jgi:hypothetical protein